MCFPSSLATRELIKSLDSTCTERLHSLHFSLVDQARFPVLGLLLPWFGEEILVYGNRLCSTHCRELPYEDLCKHAYLVAVYHATIVAIGHGL